MSRTDWIFEPEDFLRYLRSMPGTRKSDLRLPPRILMFFGGDDRDALCAMTRARKTRWDPSYSVGRAGRHRLAVLRLTIGAPAATIGLEEAVAMGARTILTMGGCGSLEDSLPIGSLVIPSQAFSDEGMSRHYGGGPWTRPDLRLVRVLENACRARGREVRVGGVWTMDAVYRESRRMARSLSRQGVVAVDMEASAMYTVARARGVRIASLFVVSDELGGDAWNAGFVSPAYLRGKEQARTILFDVMAQGLP